MPEPLFLPPSLALVDSDPAFSTCLGQALHARGLALRWFASAEALLAQASAFAQDCYVLELQLPGLDGMALLAQLRQHSDAAVVVVTRMAGPALFEQVLAAGADMHLTKPATAAQVLLAVGSVHRRVAPMLALRRAWRLDRDRRQLIAPDGALVGLSATDCVVLECLVDAQGDTVSPQDLALRLGWDGIADPNLLHATMYRLRRRIGQATLAVVPLQSKSRRGYVFKAPLMAL